MLKNHIGLNDHWAQVADQFDNTADFSFAGLEIEVFEFLVKPLVGLRLGFKRNVAIAGWQEAVERVVHHQIKAGRRIIFRIDPLRQLRAEFGNMQVVLDLVEGDSQGIRKFYAGQVPADKIFDTIVFTVETHVKAAEKPRHLSQHKCGFG
jgi:hypothetical protein